MAQRKERIT